jgi:HK97 family phage major capsid protein/HK97 family phage prohead protease
MPIPTPRRGESQDDFISRCMGNPTMVEDFAEADERAAVCHDAWRNAQRAADPQRAHSILTIKSVNEERRQIEGVASTPEVDRQRDIVEPLGAKFSLPMPLLWQHKHDQPVGTVTFAKATKDGINFRAQIAKVDEPGRLQDRINEAWQSVKLGLVRGVSIGFSPQEFSFLESGGIHFLEWSWLELSLVTIPANESANIQTIKSIDDAQLQAASGTAQRSPKPGVSGSRKPVKLEGRVAKKTVAEQIAALEAARQAKTARMQEIMEKAAERGETLDAAEGEEYDGLADELKSLDIDLNRWKSLERSFISTARQVEGHSPDEGSQSRSGNPVNAQRVVHMGRELEKGIGFARFARCLIVARGNPVSALAIAEQNYPDHRDLHTVLKAAVAAGSTTNPTWAGNLVQYQNLVDEFIEFLRPATVIGRIPGLRRVPFNVRVGRQTAGGSAYWVGEGQPKPVTSLAFDTVTLLWTKLANIAVFTDELARFSSPSVDTLVRDDLAAAIIQEQDTAFLDPANAGTANVKPASILNGTTPIVSSGTDADAVRSDALALLNTFITAGVPTGGLVWITTESIASVLETMVNAMGVREFPTVMANGGTFMGRPLIASQVIPPSGSPLTSNLALINPRDIMLADDGEVTIDASREASLQMDSAPTNASTGGSPPAPTATTLVSMFQTNSVAVRAERYINWAKARASAARYVSGAHYAI